MTAALLTGALLGVQIASLIWARRQAQRDADNADYAALYEKAEDECDVLRERKDGAYLERNQCVALIARMALRMGRTVVVTRTAIEGWSEDWHGCVYIELPTGQVSWHFHDSQAELFSDLPRGDMTWDGHDTPEKYRRVMSAFLVQPVPYEPNTTSPAEAQMPVANGRVLSLVNIRQRETPCGECHLNPGERCDICGAVNWQNEAKP
jgi:hypothetical protein